MVATSPLSKAECLKRYLSGADAGQEGGSESLWKRRKKGPKTQGTAGKGLRIVDDDVGWAAISTTKLEREEEEDGDLPVVAELVDERPEEVKQMEAFRSSAKWKLLGDHSGGGHFHHDERDPSSPRRVRHDSPEPSLPRRTCLSPPRRSPRSGNKTVFRDKSGRKRNLKLERLQQRRKAEKDSKRDELYAQWGKGLAQSRQQQQNVEDAMKEMQKPLARSIDDEDLDRMLREQEREGDPMVNFIKKNKAEENKHKKVRPRYNGPAPPPNRFGIGPGYRWDGVDRSNGFEQKRFARLASKKAVEELAYKWSVEDM
ncbi:BUD13 homolog [Arvicola amphibius]|uniref:BUD13 homolog n=1 Tax=Arvicola amphibius TaxID=1047088 RepID=UPI0018E33249|nr:BUD13 homolog [Arvicola amphibius]